MSAFLLSKQSKAVQTAAILLSIALIILLLVVGKNIITPILISILLAILLRPIVNFFSHRLKLPDVVATLFTVAILFLVMFAVLFFISWQIAIIAEDWAEIKANVILQYHALQQWIADSFSVNFTKQQSYIDSATDNAMQADATTVGNALGSITDIIINAIAIPVYTFLFLFYRKILVKGLYKLINAKNHGTLTNILLELKVVVHSYIIGLLIQMLIVSALTAGGLMLLGVKYAIFLGVITALLNLIPYIGIMLATVISLFATLATPNNLFIMLWVVLLAAVVQLIDNNILVPKIVGDKVKLNALASIVCVIIGGTIAGVSGMFLAIPLLAIIKVIFDRIEALAPWGYLLGSENSEKKIREKINSARLTKRH